MCKQLCTHQASVLEKGLISSFTVRMKRRPVKIYCRNQLLNTIKSYRFLLSRAAPEKICPSHFQVDQSTLTQNTRGLIIDSSTKQACSKFFNVHPCSVAMPKHVPLRLPIPLNVKCSFHFNQTSFKALFN